MSNSTAPSSLAAGAMPCPRCASPRVGNRRAACSTCNAFAQRVRRQVLARIQRSLPNEYERLKAEVEAELYAQLTEGQER